MVEDRQARAVPSGAFSPLWVIKRHRYTLKSRLFNPQ
jgi:hypothetical protein